MTLWSKFSFSLSLSSEPSFSRSSYKFVPIFSGSSFEPSFFLPEEVEAAPSGFSSSPTPHWRLPFSCPAFSVFVIAAFFYLSSLGVSFLLRLVRISITLNQVGSEWHSMVASPALLIHHIVGNVSIPPLKLPFFHRRLTNLGSRRFEHALVKNPFSLYYRGTTLRRPPRSHPTACTLDERGLHTFSTLGSAIAIFKLTFHQRQFPL
jgi:hypothetical protein